MNKKIRTAFLASAAALMPQIGSAALLVGISDFTVDGPDANSLPDNPVPAISGTAGFTGEFGYQSAYSAGGSIDGTYGPAVGLAPPPGSADGSTAGISGISADSSYFAVTNGSGANQQLGYLLFDAATIGSLTQGTLSVSYAISGGSSGNYTPISVALGSGNYTSSFNYADFFINVSNLTLNNGATITFSFVSDVAHDIALDNIALTSFASGGVGGVPEPGSLLALGCLMGGGAFMRSRRRR